MRHFALVATLIALFLFLAHFLIPTGPPGFYDEADYLFAARLGLVANYTDQGAMPITQFVREGLGRGMSPLQRKALSEAVRDSNDMVFYRHWHGPVYFDWLIPAAGLTGNIDQVRWLCALVPLVTLLVIYFGCLWVIPGRQGMLSALLCSALFALSGITVASLELAPHQMFVLWYIASLLCLAKMIAARERRYFYWAVVAAAVAFCTLEVAFVLVAVLLVCAFQEREWLGFDLRFAGRSLGLFLLTVLIVWPGAILKLSFVKAYLFMAYLAVFRKTPWGQVGFGETWQRRFAWSPFEWVLIAGAVLLLAVGRRWAKPSRYLYPFAVFVALMLLVTLKVAADSPRYALPFQPAIEVLAGCTLAGFLTRLPASRGYAVAALLCGALFCTQWLVVSRRPWRGDPRPGALIAAVKEQHIESSTILAPAAFVPTLHYYFPSMRLRGFEGSAPEPQDFEGKRFQGVLYTEGGVRYQPL